jgi:hypothetical protein
MEHGERFRLKSPTFAITLREGRHATITLPQGATIEVIGAPLNGTRLMDVRCNDELVLMFAYDLNQAQIERIEKRRKIKKPARDRPE